jgi:hypothetical protein
MVEAFENAGAEEHSLSFDKFHIFFVELYLPVEGVEQ